MTMTEQFDVLNRLQSILSVSPGPTLSEAYLYSHSNKRACARFADASYWSYGYDTLGEVTSGKKPRSDFKAVAGQQFECPFDSIGNRPTAASG